jgi:hypothetical protein
MRDRRERHQGLAAVIGQYAATRYRCSRRLERRHTVREEGAGIVRLVRGGRQARLNKAPSKPPETKHIRQPESTRHLSSMPVLQPFTIAFIGRNSVSPTGRSGKISKKARTIWLCVRPSARGNMLQSNGQPTSGSKVFLNCDTPSKLISSTDSVFD